MATHTFAAGEALTAANMNTYASHTGSAWDTYTPVVTQSTTPTITVNRASYCREGRHITVNVVVTVSSGTGTANNAVVVTLPVTAATGVATSPIGTGWIQDNSAAAFYNVNVLYASTTTVNFFAVSGNVANFAGQTGSPFAAALASSDVIAFTCTYEAAAG